MLLVWLQNKQSQTLYMLKLSISFSAKAVRNKSSDSPAMKGVKGSSLLGCLSAFGTEDRSCTSSGGLLWGGRVVEKALVLRGVTC